MEKTVQLRNSTGQFCNLRDFCAEEPCASISKAYSPKEALENLESDRQAFLRAKQMAEIIKAYGLFRLGASKVVQPGYGIALNADGTWGLSYGGIGIDAVLQDMKSTLAHNEQLAAAWTATEYTVETED